MTFPTLIARVNDLNPPLTSEQRDEYAKAVGLEKWELIGARKDLVPAIAAMIFPAG